MGIEIERKFLVDLSRWIPPPSGTAIAQGYLARSPDRTVRVRITPGRATLNIKGRTSGMVRPEFEYDIPPEDARELLSLCEGAIVEKVRYLVEHEGFTWEVDVFLGDNDGLVVAEVELDDPRQQPPLPGWIGREVTDDPAYYNANLIDRPFRSWA